MNQVVISRTALKVSRLSFGTASLHHLATRRSRQRLLARATELGFSHFDTAPLYGFGLAEEELGIFMASQASNLTVATKIGLYPPRGSRASTVALWAHKALARALPSLARPVVNWSIKTAEASLHRSLRRLRRDCIDILFLHEPDPRLVNADEISHWLERQRAAGKIRYYGLAGDASRFLPWVAARHALCEILQIRDSLTLQHANAVMQTGRALQFTFGYLSSTPSTSSSLSTYVHDTIRAALARAHGGSVLISTRQLKHIEQLTIAESEAPLCA